MNRFSFVLFGAAAIFLVAEVSGRSLKGIKDDAYDGCGCKERLTHAVGVEKYPLRLPAECHRPGDTCRCTKVKVTPATLPRPKYYRQPAEIESCSGYIKAPKHMHDFSSYEDTSAEEDFVKLPVDTVSMNIAQEHQRKMERKQTEEDLTYGFRSIPAERPLLKFRKNVPEGDLMAYEKTIVELQPHKTIVNCGDDDLDAFEQDVKQPISYLSYGDIGYAPVHSKSSNKFMKKNCMVHDEPDMKIVKKVTKKVFDVKDDGSEYVIKKQFTQQPKKVVHDDSYEQEYIFEKEHIKTPVEVTKTKKIVYDNSDETAEYKFEEEYKKNPVVEVKKSKKIVHDGLYEKDDSSEYVYEHEYTKKPVVEVQKSKKIVHDNSYEISEYKFEEEYKKNPVVEVKKSKKIVHDDSYEKDDSSEYVYEHEYTKKPVVEVQKSKKIVHDNSDETAEYKFEEEYKKNPVVEVKKSKKIVHDDSYEKDDTSEYVYEHEYTKKPVVEVQKSKKIVHDNSYEKEDASDYFEEEYLKKPVINHAKKIVYADSDEKDVTDYVFEKEESPVHVSKKVHEESYEKDDYVIEKEHKKPVVVEKKVNDGYYAEEGFVKKSCGCGM